MKIKMIKISSILLMALLILSSMQMIAGNAMGNDDDVIKVVESNIDNVYPATGESIPLTNVQIDEKWSNLPTARQLYENGSTSRHLTSHDEQPPTNCTATLPAYLTGNDVTVTNIWLQYDDNTWVQVPYSYLDTALGQNYWVSLFRVFSSSGVSMMSLV